MRTREFVLGLQGDPTRIDKLIAAGVVGGDPAYWKAKLPNPDDPEWYNFVNAVEVQTAIFASRQAKPATFTITGKATPT